MARLLVLLDHKQNRQLLTERLEGEYEVATDEAALAEPFDLCLVDGLAVHRLWQRLEERRRREEPVLVPVLLVASREDVGLRTRQVWRVVDDLLLTPVLAVELQARVKVLLRSRELSQTVQRLSEEHHRALVEASQEWMFTLDTEGRYTQVNSAMLRSLGLSPEDLLGKSVTAVHPREEGRDYLIRVEDVLRTRQPQSFEHRLVWKGEEFWHLDTLYPLLDSGGEVLALGGTCHDFTEQKRAALAVEQARAEMEHVLAATPAVIYRLQVTTDQQGRATFTPTFVSDTLRNVLGCDPEQCFGDPDWWRRRLHPEHAEEVCAHMETLLREGHLVHEYPLADDAGEYHWIRDELSVLRDEAGDPVEVIGTWVDLTERKETEDALRESEEKFRLLVERAMDGVFLAQNGIIRYANPRLAEMGGYTVEELLGASFLEYVHPEERERLAELHRRRMAREEVPVHYETRLLRSDGQTRDAEISTAAVPYQGRPAGLVIVRDITERKAAEQARERLTGRLELLHGIDRAILAAQSAEEVAQSAVSGLGQLAPCRRVGVVLFDEERGTADLIALHTQGETARGRGWTQPLEEFGDVEALKSGEVCHVPDLRNLTRLPRSVAVLAKEGIASYFKVPLRVGEAVLGSLNLAAAEPHAFTDEHVEIAREAADSVATALQMAGYVQRLERTEAELRDLSRRLVTAHEEERRRIAYELHDEIGQMLTGVKLELEGARRLPESALRDRLDEARGRIVALMDRVRALSLDFRPSMLDDLGLLPALRALARRYQEQAGIVVLLTGGEEVERFDEPLEIAAYRIVQEALTNVARHAQVKSVEVDVRRAEGQLSLRIADRGRGFHREAVGDRSLGLTSMRERAAMVGGELTLTSHPGEGTTVEARLPFLHH